MAVTSILVVIFLSNQLIRYLGQAAAGTLPGIYVLRLIWLEIPHLLGLLLPLGFFISLLLVFGRLYVDSEMTVMFASGVGPNHIIKITMTLAVFFALVVAIFTLVISPRVLQDRESVRSQGYSASVIEMMSPGRFRQMHQGKEVMYVEELSRDRDEARRVFIAKFVKNENPDKKGHWDVVSAKAASVVDDESRGQSYVVLKEGYRYMGHPGEADFKQIKFSKYGVRMAARAKADALDARSLPTKRLFKEYSTDSQMASELQWRLSIPLSVLVLSFLAVSLSRVTPQRGRYAQLFPAALLYMVYANLIILARNWVKIGVLPSSVGIWPIHIAFLALGITLLYFQSSRNSVRKQQKFLKKARA